MSTINRNGFEFATEADLQFTNVVDYGTSLEDLLSGAVAPPPQGARVDISFEGPLSGPLTGSLSGTDYANIRADGRFELNIHAEIVTDDGARIAYQGQGVSVPQEDGTANVREAITLSTSEEKYLWVNGVTFIAEGTADPANGTVSLSVFK